MRAANFVCERFRSACNSRVGLRTRSPHSSTPPDPAARPPGDDGINRVNGYALLYGYAGTRYRTHRCNNIRFAISISCAFIWVYDLPRNDMTPRNDSPTTVLFPPSPPTARVAGTVECRDRAVTPTRLPSKLPSRHVPRTRCRFAGTVIIILLQSPGGADVSHETVTFFTKT